MTAINAAVHEIVTKMIQVNTTLLASHIVVSLLVATISTWLLWINPPLWSLPSSLLLPLEHTDNWNLWLSFSGSWHTSLTSSIAHHLHSIRTSTLPNYTTSFTHGFVSITLLQRFVAAALFIYICLHLKLYRKCLIFPLNWPLHTLTKKSKSLPIK